MMNDISPAGQFTRRIEDFVCGNCKKTVKGNGYTNHCPHCLWSCHVDVNPGDRAANCGALMQPVDLEIKAGDYIITHKCTAPGCTHVRRNKASPADNQGALRDLSSRGIYTNQKT